MMSVSNSTSSVSAKGLRFLRQPQETSLQPHLFFRLVGVAMSRRRLVVCLALGSSLLIGSTVAIPHSSLASRPRTRLSPKATAEVTLRKEPVKQESEDAFDPEPVRGFEPPLLFSTSSLVTNAPTNLSVTGASSTTIALSWTAPTGSIDHYQIERSQSLFSVFTGIANTTLTFFNDTIVSSVNSYLYRVRAIDGGGLPSQPSNIAMGTSITFADDALVAGVTLIKAQHVYDLRLAVNAVRRVANLSDATWTDTILSGVTIQAEHVRQLRERLGEALAVLSVSIGSYTDPVLTAGATLVRKAHIAELRLVATRGISNSSGLEAAVVGQWSPVVNWPAVAVHMHVLPDSRVMIWDTTSNARVVDPYSGNSTLYANPTTNLFCSGHSLMADGRLLVTGGHRNFSGDGVVDANIFDYRTNTWTRGPDMNLGRWYPTTCALANGETLTLSGWYCSANCNPPFTGPTVTLNPRPQVLQTTGAWRDLTNAERGDLSLFPWLLLAPDGRVFQAGPESNTKFLNTTGTGSWTPPQGDLLTVSGTFRDYGSCVMYAAGKVLIMGGGGVPNPDPNLNNRPTNTAEVIDLNSPSPAWRQVGSMAFRRRQTIATILADGKVLVTGGTSGAGFNNPCDTVLPAEIWNPTTETWSTMAGMQIPRIYHLTAVLLPDGRVVAAGSTAQNASPEYPCSTPQPDRTNAEIYSPPYLFNANGGPATRPMILSAPTSITYGQNFPVNTPDAANITRVTLIRPSSVTHSFNQNQRFNQLTFAQAGGGLSVAAPANPNLCPPGDYMLFIFNQSGVPSIARILRIGA